LKLPRWGLDGKPHLTVHASLRQTGLKRANGDSLRRVSLIAGWIRRHLPRQSSRAASGLSVRNGSLLEDGTGKNQDDKKQSSSSKKNI